MRNAHAQVAQSLLQNILDAETGQRGYLLTGEARYREPYDRPCAQVDSQSGRACAGSTPRRAADIARLRLLSQHVSRKLAEMDMSVRLRQQRQRRRLEIRHHDRRRPRGDGGHPRRRPRELIAISNEHVMLGQAQIAKSLRFARIGIALVAVAGLLAFYLYLRQTHALRSAGERQQEALQRERNAWRTRCASAPPRWPSSPPTCSRCAKTSAASWRASCTTSWARC